MRRAILGLALVGIIVWGVSLVAGPVQITPSSQTAADRERPAIQAALERMLAAERSKDLEAIRRQVTRGTLFVWDRDVREKFCADLADCVAGSTLFADNTARVEITWLGVDANSRWALAYVKGLGLSNSVDLFREDGVWKVDAQLNEFVAMFATIKIPTVPLSPTLTPIMLTAAELPAGWDLTLDEVSTKTAGRRYYISEMRGLELRRRDHVDGHLEYRLFSTADYADWYFWRARQIDDEAEMFDAAGAPTKSLARAVAMMTSTTMDATFHVRKGRIIAEATVGKLRDEYCTDLAAEIGKRALRKLK